MTFYNKHLIITMKHLTRRESYEFSVNHLLKSINDCDIW